MIERTSFDGSVIRCCNLSAYLHPPTHARTHSNTREKYQLLKLYRAAMQKEVLVKVDQTRDFIVGNPAVIRLVVLHHRDRDPYLKETLGPVITKVGALCCDTAGQTSASRWPLKEPGERGLSLLFHGSALLTPATSTHTHITRRWSTRTRT